MEALAQFLEGRRIPHVGQLCLRHHIRRDALDEWARHVRRKNRIRNQSGLRIGIEGLPGVCVHRPVGRQIVRGLVRFHGIHHVDPEAAVDFADGKMRAIEQNLRAKNSGAAVLLRHRVGGGRGVHHIDVERRRRRRFQAMGRSAMARSPRGKRAGRQYHDEYTAHRVLLVTGGREPGFGFRPAERCYAVPFMKILTLAALLTGAIVVYGDGLGDKYRGAAERLIDAALGDQAAVERLSYLCDRIGNRLSGSPSLNQAIAWAASEMKKDGLANVATPKVKVPHWVRGAESATIISPVRHPLTILGLGGSVSTPKQGITAPVVVVSSFDELDRLGAGAVAGKIVVYDAPYVSYMHTVVYRHAGASRAARLGAVAALVRSITPVSLQSPHTGALEYSDDAPRIPSAAITLEDATLLDRLTRAGNNVTVHLEMQAHNEADAESANVVGEIPGSERPEQIVVIGGHIDSWDVGAGAQDDGSGCITALEAARLIRESGLRPRRTLGFGVSAGEQTSAAVARLREVGDLLQRVGAGTILPGGGGADIAPIMREGVPGLAVRTTGAHYFDWHHSRADTTDKVDPNELRKNIAAMAVLAYVLADMPEPLSGVGQAPSPSR